jgi:hypothetical protein
MQSFGKQWLYGGDGSFGELEATRGPEPAEIKIGQEWISGHQQIELLLCRYYSLLLQCNNRQ